LFLLRPKKMVTPHARDSHRTVTSLLFSVIFPPMDDWSKIISTGVGPIIVISACGLLCLAFYNRLAAVVTRMRAFHRERLHAHDAMDRAATANPPNEIEIVRQQELIGMLQVQMTSV